MINCERVNLGALSEGTLFQVKIGLSLSTFAIRIIEPGLMPRCEITQLNQDGTIIAGPTVAVLEGSGCWTAPEQNPTQRGDYLFNRPYLPKAMSIDYGGLRTGHLLVAHDPKRTDNSRVYFQPACTEITF